jgi:hypothetical protein
LIDELAEAASLAEANVRSAVGVQNAGASPNGAPRNTVDEGLAKIVVKWSNVVRAVALEMT